MYVIINMIGLLKCKTLFIPLRIILLDSLTLGQKKKVSVLKTRGLRYRLSYSCLALHPTLLDWVCQEKNKKILEWRANQTSPSFEVNLGEQMVRVGVPSNLTPKTFHWLLLRPSYAEPPPPPLG